MKRDTNQLNSSASESDCNWSLLRWLDPGICLTSFALTLRTKSDDCDAWVCLKEKKNLQFDEEREKFKHQI